MATARDVPDLHQAATVARAHAGGEIERRSTARERRSGHSTRSRLRASFGISTEYLFSIPYSDRVRAAGIDVVHVETAVAAAARDHAPVGRPAAAHDT